jgi:hypothetical protein
VIRYSIAHTANDPNGTGRFHPHPVFNRLSAVSVDHLRRTRLGSGRSAKAPDGTLPKSVSRDGESLRPGANTRHCPLANDNIISLRFVHLKSLHPWTSRQRKSAPYCPTSRWSGPSVFSRIFKARLYNGSASACRPCAWKTNASKFTDVVTSG